MSEAIVESLLRSAIKTQQSAIQSLRQQHTNEYITPIESKIEQVQNEEKKLKERRHALYQELSVAREQMSIQLHSISQKSAKIDACASLMDMLEATECFFVLPPAQSDEEQTRQVVELKALLHDDENKSVLGVSLDNSATAHFELLTEKPVLHRREYIGAFDCAFVHTSSKFGDEELDCNVQPLASLFGKPVFSVHPFIPEEWREWAVDEFLNESEMCTVPLHIYKITRSSKLLEKVKLTLQTLS
jgi:hypothetical protein